MKLPVTNKKEQASHHATVLVGGSYCSGQKMPDSSWGRLSEALGKLGFWEFERGRGWVKGRAGEVSLQATWDPGGQILSQLGGFQVSRKGVRKGSKGRSARGEEKSKGNAPCILSSVLMYIKSVWNVWMIPVVYTHNNNNRNECCWYPKLHSDSEHLPLTLKN